MKCNECARRNSDGNAFCVYCGAVLEPPARQSGACQKVMLPPQDIDELISDRYLLARPQRRSPHPVVVVGLALVIGLAGIYYWFFYRDVFQIMAIDYQGTELVNE